MFAGGFYKTVTTAACSAVTIDGIKNQMPVTHHQHKPAFCWQIMKTKLCLLIFLLAAVFG